MALDICTLKRDFGDATAEAEACRAGCALFDFSFLECARLAGQHATGIIEAFTGRPLNTVGQGQICYALRIDGAGRVQADLTVWRTGPQSFEVMSGRRQDIVDLLALNAAGLQVGDIGASRAVFSVQGPGALDALAPLGDRDKLARIEYFHFGGADLAGIPCTVGRLGYTGEAGFEIIVGRDRAGELWHALSARTRPAGFVAADMLRIEAGFVLFTNEFCLPVSPREAGLGKFHRTTDSAGLQLKLVSFRADAEGLVWPWQAARVPPRPAAPGVIAVTSACDSVASGGVLGLGYVRDGTATDGPLQDASATFRNIRITPLPFYDTAKRRPRASWR